MSLPEAIEPPAGLSFGALLDWHLRRGTRPPGTPNQGMPWKIMAFAGNVGLSDKQVRNWIANKSLPNDTITIERVLIGRDQAHRMTWRMQLRDALKHTRDGTAPAASPPEIATTPPVPASNIPIRVPTHFMGRDDALAQIATALAQHEGRVAITALHGLRGVGKTTLAAAYADRRRGDYRATWWIRAQSETSMRADLVGLGIRLGWVRPDDKEEPALAAVMERLRHEGEGILLIYDNAVDADALKPHLPRGGAARVLVTSNAHAWRGVAVPVEIRVWHKETGADYLIARTGRTTERAAAEALSEALGGLPLAHEQAAAYCERLEISCAEYQKRFSAAALKLLGDKKSAPVDYHPDYAVEHKDRLTVAGTFTLAIAEASKLHPAAEPLLVHTALLAPDPIPLFLFAEAREKFSEPLASALAGDGLEESVAALRAFALVERETIADERDAAITTDAIRLHRLVREVAAARREGEAREQVRGALVAAMVEIYPGGGWRNPGLWPRCATLAPHVVAICGAEMVDATAQCAELLQRAGSYFHGRAADLEAKPLFKRVLAIRETALGAEHPDTAKSLNNLAVLLQAQGDYAEAKPLYERALAIHEKALGAEHPDTAVSLNRLASLLGDQGNYTGAKPLFERALAIQEKVLEPDHPDTVVSPRQPRDPALLSRQLCRCAAAFRAGAGDPREGAGSRASRYGQEPQQPRVPASRSGR